MAKRGILDIIKGQIQGPVEEGQEELLKAWANKRQGVSDVEWATRNGISSGGYAIPKEMVPRQIRELRQQGYCAWPGYQRRRNVMSEKQLNEMFDQE